MTKRRIAIAGFQHETNSFAPTCANWAAFEMADSWPGLLTGEAVVTGTHGMNLPIAGAIHAAMAAEIEERYARGPHGFPPSSRARTRSRRRSRPG